MAAVFLEMLDALDDPEPEPAHEGEHGVAADRARPSGATAACPACRDPSDRDRSLPPPGGASPIAPSSASQAQSMPTSSAWAARSPRRQISWITPAPAHSWKRRWAADEEQIPVALKACH